MNWLTHTLSLDGPPQLTSLMATSNLIMLAKDDGSIRPILVSSIWTKIFNAAVANKAAAEMTAQMQGTQFAHLSQGSSTTHHGH